MKTHVRRTPTHRLTECGRKAETVPLVVPMFKTLGHAEDVRPTCRVCYRTMRWPSAHPYT